MESPKAMVARDVAVRIEGAEGAEGAAEIRDAVPGANVVSKAKLLRAARRMELRKGWKHYPPGSSWERRDGSTAKAGPRYGDRL